MSDQGWIKLYRKIQSSFVWTNSDQLKLWLLILMKANHSQNKFLFNGQEISVTSGQCVTGAHVLASEFNAGVPRDNQLAWRKLWRWVKRFEKSGMLTIQSNARYSVITVVNWYDYQESDNLVTIQRQSADNPMTTNKNDKNEEKEPTSDSTRKIDYKKIINFLNEKTNSKFHNVKSNQDLIRARINEGYSEHDVGLVIAVKAKQWVGNSEMEKYLRPKTLFAKSHFDEYLNEAQRSQQRANTPEQQGLTPEEGSARSARQLAELEEKYKNQGVSDE
ncbi:conserved phage C-terminal domain-containing protein [Levilactobacillus sp. N40-8-2]|uniref:conserved phage C-terminal domain-containing protein n=1 Tax=Levilactobacillus muriae TaxID=3238987 RepID=UPI0038B38284